MVRIFGISNGGLFASIAMVIALPASSLASYLLAYIGVAPYTIFLVGTAFTTINLFILNDFDDTPM